MNRTLPLSLLAVALLAGCGAVALDEYETCELDVVLSESAVAPGTVVTASGGPFSKLGVRDTRVELGGTPVTVTAVTRTNCDACDACRQEADCGPCGLCNGRLLDPDTRASCFGDPLADPVVVGSCAACEQSMAFEIPADAPPGPTTVWIATGEGSSDPIPFEVLGPAASTGDTAATP